MILNT